AILLDYFEGQEKIDSGTLYVDDRLVADSTKINPSSLGIYSITTHPNIMPNQPIANSLYLPVKKHIIFQKEIEVLVQDLLDSLEIDIPVGTIGKTLPHSKQILVELAKAYISKARLVIIDVNFAEFTKRDYTELLAVIKRLQKAGISFLFIFYDTTDFIHMMDRMVIFRNGKNIKTLYKPDFDPDHMKSLLIGTKVSEEVYYHQPAADIPRSLICELPGFQLPIHTVKGEILGIVDTDYYLSKALIDTYLLDKGKLRMQVELEDRSFSFKTLKQAYQNRVGFTIKYEPYSELFDNMSLTENIAMLALERVYKSPVNVSFNRHAHILFRDHAIDIPEHDRAEIGQYVNFTGYNRQKALLDRWTVFSPRLLICIKPFSSLDPLSKKLTYSYFDRFAANGTTIIIISNDLSAISPICDRMLIVGKRNITAVLQKEDILAMLKSGDNQKPHA
ncbi:MAG: hypothetical protein ACOYJB_04540, partial [Christensenellaceae bacterium]